MAGTVEATEYQFKPEDRPLIPGGPFAPAHPLARRLVYAAVAVLVGVTATLGNALVTVNVTSLAGSLGEYVAAVSWLPAIYVAMNASANLYLVKARMQFGIPAITHGFLIAYILAGLSQFIFPGFYAAVLVRAVCGVTAAALTTLTIYYLLQVFPPKIRPAALVVGISLIQFGTPIARLFPVESLARHDWQALHLMEVALACTVLAAIMFYPLPPSERTKVCTKLDFVTMALIVPAMVLLCGALNEGRLLWWTDTHWIGWALAAAVPLFAAAILVESRRAKPLLQLDWIGSAGILRFAAVAFLVRIALAEQTYGAVGLLTFSGLNNEQLRLLFAIVIVALMLGTAAAILTLSQERLRYQVMVAALIIALGAWLDAHSTNLTRPAQLYASQALIGFGTTLFIGPSLVYGFLRMLERGTEAFVSFIVTFSITQNVGGLAGSALLGTYQVAATRAHAVALSEHLIAADPQVAVRIQSGTGALAAAVTDPAQRAAQGAGLLSQALTREATILAFNDTFKFVAIIALATALYLFYLILLNRWRERRKKMEAHP